MKALLLVVPLLAVVSFATADSGCGESCAPRVVREEPRTVTNINITNAVYNANPAPAYPVQATYASRQAFVYRELYFGGGPVYGQNYNPQVHRWVGGGLYQGHDGAIYNPENCFPNSFRYRRW